MNSPYKLGLGDGSKLSYGSSYGSWPPHKPQEESNRALKIIAITGACIAVIAVLIVVIDPLAPSLVASPLNLSFTMTNGLNPSSQTIYVGSTRRAVDWSAVADTLWLIVDPLDGRTGKETPITLSADTWGMYHALVIPPYHPTNITITSHTADGIAVGNGATVATHTAPTIKTARTASIRCTVRQHE